jgi:hypothetical protein
MDDRHNHFLCSWMLRIRFFMIFSHFRCAYNLQKVASVVPKTSQKSLPLCLQPPKSHFRYAYNLPKVTSSVPTTSQKSLPLCLKHPKSHFLCAYNLPKVTSSVPTTSQKSLPSLISGGIFVSSQLKEGIFSFPTKFFRSVPISMKIALTFDFPI